MDLRNSRRNGLVGFGFAAALAGVSAGCASGSGPQDAYTQLTRVDYGKPYVGMSKAEVLKCAGQPRSRIPAGSSAETLIYHYSGAGPCKRCHEPEAHQVLTPRIPQIHAFSYA